MQFNSFISHKFLIRLSQSANATGQIEFTVNRPNEIVTASFSTDTGLKISQLSAKSENVKDRLLFATNSCAKFKGSDEFSGCVIRMARPDFEDVQEETKYAKRSSDLMTSRLRNYTCSDPNLQTSPALYSTIFNDHDRSLQINMLLDNSHAKIWTIDNLINDDECESLMDNARPNLSRATVSNGDGGGTVSESRKAQQARYAPKTNESNSDKLDLLFQRIYRIANSVTGFNLHHAGQEPFMAIQYGATDQYVPHCDGSCDGSRYVRGGRVATAILYCKVADVGGGTTFTNSDIFLKPNKGMATFFSYKGPDGMMDDGLTTHSGCPVLEGEKWITTAWMREGVSLEEPESFFDPIGQRFSELEALKTVKAADDAAEKKVSEVETAVSETKAAVSETETAVSESDTVVSQQEITA